MTLSNRHFSSRRRARPNQTGGLPLDSSRTIGSVVLDPHRTSDVTVFTGLDRSKNLFSVRSDLCPEIAIPRSDSKFCRFQFEKNSTPAASGVSTTPYGVVKAPISGTFAAPLCKYCGGAAKSWKLLPSLVDPEVSS